MQPISSTIRSRFIIKVCKWLAMICHPFNQKARREARKRWEWKKRGIAKLSVENFHAIPVYIISFNCLSYVKQIVEWLEEYKFTNINIIDNNSSYPPLIAYLESLQHRVYRMDKNYGHGVLWESGKFNKIIENSCYIVSDPDISVNKQLQHNFIKEFYRILEEYPNVVKVGFALDIDNLPKTENNKLVIQWEQQFWENRLDDKLEIYSANIDTTFALYRPGKLKVNTPVFYRAIRVAGTYTARHLPWYVSDEDTEESRYYYRHSNPKSATWTKDIEYYKKAVSK